MGAGGPVVTIGEAMMVFNGTPDSPVGVGSLLSATFAGAESNVAIGLARLGHRVRFLSVLGDDPFGRGIVKSLRGEGGDGEGGKMWGERGVGGGGRRGGEGPRGVMFKNRWPGDEPQVFYYRSTSAFARAGVETF